MVFIGVALVLFMSATSSWPFGKLMAENWWPILRIMLVSWFIFRVIDVLMGGPSNRAYQRTLYREAIRQQQAMIERNRNL